MTLGWAKWPRSMGVVMEYSQCGSLQQLIDNDAIRLPAKVILHFAYEISCGLSFIHTLVGKKQFVHGDLKLENVVLTDDMHCKVIDCKTAEVVSLTGATTMTSDGVRPIVSTLVYTCPEKLRHPNMESKKDQDVYGLAMIIYMLLTRQPLYGTHEEENRFVDHILKGKRPTTLPIVEMQRVASGEEAGVIQYLESLIKECWVQEPSQRPIMSDIRDRLRPICERNWSEVASNLEEIKRLLPLPDLRGNHRLIPLTNFSPLSGTFHSSTYQYSTRAFSTFFSCLCSLKRWWWREWVQIKSRYLFFIARRCNVCCAVSSASGSLTSDRGVASSGLAFLLRSSSLFCHSVFAVQRSRILSLTLYRREKQRRREHLPHAERSPGGHWQWQRYVPLHTRRWASFFVCLFVTNVAHPDRTGDLTSFFLLSGTFLWSSYQFTGATSYFSLLLPLL